MWVLSEIYLFTAKAENAAENQVPGTHNQREGMPGSFGTRRIPEHLRIEDGLVDGKSCEYQMVYDSGIRSRRRESVETVDPGITFGKKSKRMRCRFVYF